MPHTYTSILFHVVFSTKDRLPLITPDLEQRLYPYMNGIFSDLRGKLYAANGETDHAHLLAAFPPTIAPAELIGKVKGCSSKWINETDDGRFEWQRGYAAFSVSKSNVPHVAKYIERQKEHHKKFDFREEFMRLLKKHGIDPDERFLWT